MCRLCTNSYDVLITCAAREERRLPPSLLPAPLFLCTGRLPPQRRFGAQPPEGRLLAHRCAFLFLLQGEKEMGGANPRFLTRKESHAPGGGASRFLKGKNPPRAPKGAQSPPPVRGNYPIPWKGKPRCPRRGRTPPSEGGKKRRPPGNPGAAAQTQSIL